MVLGGYRGPGGKGRPGGKGKGTKGNRPRETGQPCLGDPASLGERGNLGRHAVFVDTTKLFQKVVPLGGLSNPLEAVIVNPF